jgi:hypothetical protein
LCHATCPTDNAAGFAAGPSGLARKCGTQPGGHYTKATESQHGLNNKIQDYIDAACDGDGGTGPVPQDATDLAGQYIQPPVIPSTTPNGTSGNSSGPAQNAFAALLLAAAALLGTVVISN